MGTGRTLHSVQGEHPDCQTSKHLRVWGHRGLPEADLASRPEESCPANRPLSKDHSLDRSLRSRDDMSPSRHHPQCSVLQKHSTAQTLGFRFFPAHIQYAHILILKEPASESVHWKVE
ncbi:hypothetical protein MC885_021382, partial [Smutsia gigantea]